MLRNRREQAAAAGDEDQDLTQPPPYSSASQVSHVRVDAQLVSSLLLELEGISQGLPPCAEKTVGQLDLLIQMMSLGVSSVVLDGVPVVLEPTYVNSYYLARLKSIAENMGLSPEVVSQKLDSINTSLLLKNYEKASEGCRALSKLFQPFSISDCVDLIAKSKEAGSNIAGQDVILLLGQTGVGKSTLIHYLCGSTLKSQVVDGLSHIGPVDVRNESLMAIKTSPHKRSETRYISAVGLQYSDLGIEREGGVFLCDTPGFEDTGGAEIDIANSLGVVESLKSARSVRVVVLFARDVGRGESFRDTAHLLVKLVREIERHIDTFSFVFTKHTPEQLQEVHAELRSIKEHSSEQEKADRGLMRLFEAMLEETEDGALGFNPLSGGSGAKKFLKKLLTKESIRKPGEVFCFSASERSRHALREQLALDQHVVRHALSIKEFGLVHYKLDQFLTLVNLLGWEHVTQAYAACVNLVALDMRYRYERAKKLMLPLSEGQPLSEKVLAECDAIRRDLRAFAPIRASHAKEESVSEEVFLQFLSLEVQKCLDRLAQCAPDTQLFFIEARNLKLMSETWGEFAENYQQVIAGLLERARAFVLPLVGLLESGDYQSCADCLARFFTCAKFTAESLSLDDLRHQYQQMCEEDILGHFAKVTSLDCLVGELTELQEPQLLEIEGAISRCSVALKTPGLFLHIDRQRLESSYTAILAILKAYFEGLQTTIRSEFDSKREQAFELLEKRLSSLTRLHRMPGVEAITSASYYSVIQLLCGFVKELRRDAEQAFQDFMSDKEDVDFQRLSRGVISLRKASWLEQYQPGVISEALEEVNGDIYRHVHTQIENFQECSLEIGQIDRIHSGIKLYQRLNLMSSLDAGIPELAGLRASFHEWLIAQLENQLLKIRTFYNVDRGALKELERIEDNYLRCFEKGEQEKKQLIQDFLKSVYFAAPEEIQAELKKQNDHLEELGQKLLSQQALYDEEEQSLVKLRSLLRRHQASWEAAESDKARAKLLTVLQKDGFEDDDELKAAILEKQKSLQAKQAMVDGVKEDIARNGLRYQELEAIDLKLEALIDQQNLKVQRAGSEILEPTGYTVIEDLSKNLEVLQQRLSQQIDVSLLQNIGEDEAVVDLDFAERVFNYFEVCTPLTFIKQLKNFKATEGIFSNYMRQLSRKVEEEIWESFSDIKTAATVSLQESSLLKSAQLLLSRYKYVREIQDHYPRAFKCFSPALLDDFSHQLQAYFIELSDELVKLSVARASAELKMRLNIARALGRFDFLMSAGSGFMSLYTKYRDVFYEDAKVTSQTLAAIKDHNYVEIASDLSRLSQLDDPTTRYAVTQIQDALSRVLKDLMEGTKTEVIMLRSNIDEQANQTIRTIKTNLDKLREAQNLLDPFLQDTIKADIKDCVDQVKRDVSRKVIRFLDGLEASLDARNFYESDVGVEYVNQAKSLLGRYCTEDIVQRLESLEARIEGCLEEVVTKFSLVPIEQYNTNPPRELFAKFEKATGRNQKYNKAKEKLQTSIVDKCRETLDQARKLAKPESKNEYVRKVKIALRFLPDNLKDALQHELDAAREDIESLIEETKGVVTELVDSEDLSGMRRYMDENKQSPSAVGAMKYLEEQVVASVKTLNLAISECMDQSDYLSMMPQLKKLFDYQYYFSDKISQVSHYYATVQIRLAAILEDCWKAVTVGFSLDEDAGQFAIEPIDSVASNFDNLAHFVDLYFWLKEKFNDASSPRKQGSGELTLEQLKLRDALPVDFIEKQLKIHQAIFTYFDKVRVDLQEAINDLNTPSLCSVLDRLKRWDRLLASVKRYTDTRLGVSELVEIDKLAFLLKEVRYNLVLKRISDKIMEIHERVVRVEFLNPEIQATNKSRERFYQDFNKDCDFIRALKEFKGHYNPRDINIAEIQKAVTSVISRKLDVLIKEAFVILKGELVNQAYYKNLNAIYQNFSVITKLVVALVPLGIDVNAMLQTLRGQIIDKVDRFESNARAALATAELEQVAKWIIQIKLIGENILLLKEFLDVRIDAFLNGFKKLTNGSQLVAKLGVILNGDPEGIGQIILSEHKCFVGYAISLFNQKTMRHGLAYVLEHIDGDSVSKAKLEKAYTDFHTLYERLVKENLRPDVDLGRLKTGLLDSIASIKVKVREDAISWPSSLVNKIPSVLAHLFAIWTLKNAGHYFDAEGVSDRDNYLMQPHAAQVVSILRMLGADTTSASLENHLVQIGTGEGKSVTLAITASLFALLGFEVSCVCYSPYLSERDRQAFADLFDELEVTERVHYGTFNQLCESVINERGVVRDLVLQALDPRSAKPRAGSDLIPRNKILLIDEVDVFFSKDFYGSVYTPSARLQHPTISSLVNFIWENRSSISLKKVKDSQAYKDCCVQYVGWETLIGEAVKDMISDASSYLTHEYLVKDDRIGYKDQDTIVTNMLVGYKTLFAYYHEHQQGKITEKSLRENTMISIQCGNFSYAEIPHLYNAILGVTGTLKTLSDRQKTIICETYKIEKKTYAPSVFGQNNLRFNEVADIFIESAADYPVALTREINNRLQGRDPKLKRAVLVFFEDQEKLHAFRNSPAFATLKDQARVMTEELDSDEKSMYVKQATNSGQVTLLTRSFGRGVDFVCRDQVVYANGGVHVIQTFLSTERSEETQIKGRTARQGDEGSYSMVLNMGALEYFHVTPAAFEEAKAEKSVYTLLDTQRNVFFDKQYAEDTKFVEQNKVEHEQSMRFVEALLVLDIEYIKQFLGERNQGALSVQSRTICLMDGTGSMAHLMQKAKTTVGEMFNRAKTVLQDNGLPESAFEMQFVVFRNYDCDEARLLQVSSWESKPDSLRQFMEKVRAEGGTWMEEAVEIGLWHANEEHLQGKVDQVILIGDAPSNSPDQVRRGRSQYKGEAYWAKTKFSTPTTVDEQLNRLASERIPVHGFYVTKHASTVGFFKDAASRTGGRSEFLDVNSKAGADMLTDMVTEEVLRSVGNNRFGDGTKLVEAYRSRYAKSYTS